MPADFDPQRVLIDWRDGTAFTITEAQAGVVVFGASGGGKTSGPGRLLAHAYLRAGFGFLVMCAKVEEASIWRKFAEETGRTDDLIVVDAHGKNTFNFLEWNTAKGEAGAGFAMNTVALLDEIAGIVDSGAGDSDSGGDNAFFRSALRHLITNLVDLSILAGFEVALPLMRQIASTAPLSIAQRDDPEWQRGSTCWQLLREADQRTRDNPAARSDFEECRAYFEIDWPALSDRTRSVIQLQWSMLVRPFVTRPLRALFSEGTTVTPEDAFAGKIIVLDLPVQEYRLAGRMAQLAWKWCFQLAVMRRRRGAEPLRPVVLWSDEAQSFLSETDAEYQAVARSGGGCTVYLTQQRESVRRALKSDETTENLLANLSTKFFCSNTGATNEWASTLIGERYLKITSTNIGRSGAASGAPTNETTATAAVTRSEEKRRFIEPNRFTTLKRGGPVNGYTVEAVVYGGGKLFDPDSAEPQPFKILGFRQS